MTCNTTFSNTTFHHCEDVVVDTSQTFLARKLVRCFTGLFMSTIGFWLSSSVLGYLRNKTGATQSLIDIPIKLLFSHLCLETIWILIFNIIRDVTIDTGDTLAKVVMWPTYDFGLVTITILALSPLLHSALVLNPSLELPFSDAAAFWILYLAVWIPNLLINLFFHLGRYYPVSYYLLREMPMNTFDLPGLVKLLRMLGGCLASGVFRYIVTKKIRVNTQENEESNQLITGKVIAWVTAVLVLTAFLSPTIDFKKFENRAFVIQPIQIICVSIPAMVIYSNKKVRSYFLSSLPDFKTCCMSNAIEPSSRDVGAVSYNPSRTPQIILQM